MAEAKLLAQSSIGKILESLRYVCVQKNRVTCVCGYRENLLCMRLLTQRVCREREREREGRATAVRNFGSRTTFEWTVKSGPYSWVYFRARGASSFIIKRQIHGCVCGIFYSFFFSLVCQYGRVTQRMPGRALAGPESPRMLMVWNLCGPRGWTRLAHCPHTHTHTHARASVYAPVIKADHFFFRPLLFVLIFFFRLINN